MSIVCPKCNAESAKPGWCGHCEHYHLALRQEQPIYLNAIVDQIMFAAKRQIDDGSPFQLSLEPQISDGNMWWVAYIKLGNGIWKCTKNPQESPSDALRELAEMVNASL